jgi:hypothetical protein
MRWRSSASGARSCPALLRLVYRQNAGQTILIAAVAVQVSTGLTMVWKYYLRRATPLRNLQLVSGLYLAVFLVTHLITVFTTRHSGIDTDFVWASHAPSGLLCGLSTVPLLPRYSLAVLAVFAHLACQARWNLSRVISESAARKASYKHRDPRWGGDANDQPRGLWRAFHEINSCT